MSSVVADTHTIIWHVTNSPRLSHNAREALRQTLRDGFPILMSAVSVAELIYATEKLRLPAAVLEIILDAAHRDQYGLKVVAFDLEMAEIMKKVPRNIVPDLPDRMIAATSLTLQLPLVTVDKQIHQSGVPVIW